MRSRTLIDLAFLMLATAVGACSSDDASPAIPDAGEASVPSNDGGLPDAGGADATADASTHDAADGSAGDAAIACPADSYEPNNTATGARALALDAKGAADLRASLARGDDDIFGLTVIKADPVHATVTYAAADANDKTQLTLTAANATTGNPDGDFRDETARTGASQTLDVFFQPAASQSYTLQVTSDTAACTSYELTVDTRACTDAYEDNDTLATAQTVSFPLADQGLTVTRLDQDFFKLPTSIAGGGTCTAKYAVPAASDTQQLEVRLFDSSKTAIATTGYLDTARRTALSQTLTVTWTAGGIVPAYVQVLATGDTCQAYTLECH